MRNIERRVEELEEKVNVAEVDTLCICKFYSDYKECNCREAYAKIKAEGREPTLDDFYKMGKPKSSVTV